VVTTVETDRMAGQKPAHHRGDWRMAGTKQKMGMVGNKRPCVTHGSRVLDNFSKSFEKAISILVIKEYFPTFNSPHDYMVKSAGSIYSGLSGHRNFISIRLKKFKFKY